MRMDSRVPTRPPAPKITILAAIHARGVRTVGSIEKKEKRKRANTLQQTAAFRDRPFGLVERVWFASNRSLCFNQQ